MKARMLLSGFAALLAGCINTPQTKALITPVGAVGIYSFGPPREQPRNTEFERRVAQRLEAVKPAGT
jgi:hypothetical protein